MIDIAKGRYWDLPWSLVDGCTPCSPGCDHCWSAAIAHHYRRGIHYPDGRVDLSITNFTDSNGNFDGRILTHPERLTIPLKRRKPTVWAVWNDLFHEAVPNKFRNQSCGVMATVTDHTFLVLTKRQNEMSRYLNFDMTPAFIEDHMADYTHAGIEAWPLPNIYHGLTVCNQAEWDAKWPVFSQVPGKKFISHEPALGRIDYGPGLKDIAVLISGGETGAGARPSHPDIFRSDRDQCAAAGVPFFFKQWGEFAPSPDGGLPDFLPSSAGYYFQAPDPPGKVWRFGRTNAGRLLDGRTHDALPWAG